MSNRLAESDSAYLQEHAGNPVAWQPWDERALREAREADRPILLSIGYSACHWCHVMARECFEDEAIARLMNAHFVNIKVDREERPDLDETYQLAHQILNDRGGGWPLTVFLDPRDLAPFFAGTYFPPRPQGGMLGFAEVLKRLAGIFESQRDDIRDQSGRIRQVYLDLERRAGDAPEALHRGPLEHFTAGGEGEAAPSDTPRFPRAPALELRQRLSARGDADSDRAAVAQLRVMAERGLQDHIGGGFFRYCVDGEWRIPHFEKMLYDNALLLPLYAGAGERDAGFARVVDGAWQWLQRRMAVDGGFAASLDADNDGEEGGYYLWQREDVEACLDGESFAVAEPYFGLDRPPNFEGRAWHLQRMRDLTGIAADLGIERTTAERRLETACQRLLETRQQRRSPQRDDKVLCGWNALLARGLLQAGRRLGRDEFESAGDELVGWLWQCLWTGDGLRQRWTGGAPRGEAFLEDAAALLLAAVESLRWRCDAGRLQRCAALADGLLERFEDRDNGGFFQVPSDREAVLHRGKPMLDDSTPAPNGLACLALVQLGHLLGETRYLDAAERGLRCGWHDMQRHPAATATLLQALDEFLSPMPTIVDTGADGHEARARLRRRDDLALVPVACDQALPGRLEALRQREPAAWVCRGHTCQPPVGTLDAAEQLLYK